MRTKFIDRLLLPAIFGLTTIIAALVLWQLLILHRRVEIQAATHDQAMLVKAKTESELRARTLPLERLAGRWAVRDRADQNEMESDASLVMSGYPAYQAIEWADPSYHVRWVVPQRGNQADVGSDLGIVPGLRAALGRATRSSSTIIAPRISLRQGGRGFLICVPVEGKDMNGFLVGVFRYQDVLSTILGDVAPDYWVAIYDDTERIYSRTVEDPPPAARYVQEAGIEFEHLPWRAVVWPKAGAVPYTKTPLPTLVFGGGILMALVLGFAVYQAETAQLNVKKLAATNRELKKQIAGREQAEEALRHAQKMEAIGRLAGGVAHDFNNLLMVIRGQATLSLNNMDLDATARRELGEIVKAADRASSLTRQLLAFGRRQMLQPRVLDLNALVSQVAEILPSVLGEDIELDMDLDAELGHVRADSAQLEQVLMNLVFNARDAMPLGGQLTIQTANCVLDEAWTLTHPGVNAGPHVMLAVGDTGHGMDEATQSHIFEPFFTTKDTSKGTGLGLATVYGTVNQSGGCVTVSSKLGRGTTFQIYLPQVREPVELIEPPKPVAQPLEGEDRVLLVEDDDAVRRMTSEFLKIKGYAVVEARSAAEAIHWMEGNQGAVDLVLTDVVMPGMKGRELVEQLTPIHPGLKVLYMSAYTEDDAISIGILSPGTAFIEKPFSPDELARKVRDVLGGNGISRSDPLRHGAEA
ncbi:MAG TPA: response regulator [Candidatus Cybelea sp.]|nr:response regulator [Candidatus Cybelea sp.]